jgi:hypothetical protein
MMITASQPKTKIASVDVTAIKSGVNAVVDIYHKGVITGNVNEIKPLLEDTGLF